MSFVSFSFTLSCQHVKSLQKHDCWLWAQTRVDMVHVRGTRWQRRTVVWLLFSTLGWVQDEFWQLSLCVAPRESTWCTHGTRWQPRTQNACLADAWLFFDSCLGHMTLVAQTGKQLMPRAAPCPGLAAAWLPLPSSCPCCLPSSCRPTAAYPQVMEPILAAVTLQSVEPGRSLRWFPGNCHPLFPMLALPFFQDLSIEGYRNQNSDPKFGGFNSD